MDYLQRSRVLAAAIVVVLCVPACNRRAPSAAEMVKMRIGVPAPVTGTQTSGVRNLSRELTTDAWMSRQPDGRSGPRLVNSWQWNADGTKLHLTIRPDVYFHDGTKLTPEVAATILRASVRDREAFSFSSVTSVDVSGSDGIELTLSAPNSFVVPDLAIVTARLPANRNVGTGPFRIVGGPEANAGPDTIVVRAFDRFYRGRPALDEIDVHSYPTQRSAWTALMRGEIDMLHEVSRDAADFVQAESAIKSYPFLRPYYIPLVFNMRHPTLRNVEVRKAINEAIDRQMLIRDGLRGRGRAADGPIWPDHWAYVAAPESFTFNPTSARQRLDGAGLPVRPTTGDEMPSRLSFTCLVFGDDSRFEHLALLLQRQLADVGIDMKLQATPMRDLETRLKAGDFDAFLFEMAGRSLSWVYEFWHTREGGFVNSGYRSADAALDEIRVARSDEETRAGVARLAKILHDDPPAAFIAWQEQVRAVSTAFDVATESNRDPLTNLWLWHPVSPQVAQQARR